MAERTGRIGDNELMSAGPAGEGQRDGLVWGRPQDSRLQAHPFAGMRLVRVDDFEEAIPLAAGKRDAYRRRYATLFVDDARRRRGGIGSVTFGCNAQGESLAVKTLLLPSREPGEDEATYQARRSSLERVFRHEYENHVRLNGVRGFPRLFGYGLIEGVPAIVMEWIDGVTLAQARRRLAVDDEGRLSPLVVARLGRDLFDLLARLGNVAEGMVHRDLSPANIMVRTSHLSVERQAVEGAFDLCLIDFGSSAAVEPAASTSFTTVEGVVRAATAAYAPPEMLTSDLPDLAELRKSPKIDVYAAGSVLYQLLSGCLPFALDAQAGASPYRVKMDQVPRRPDCAHSSGCDLERVLDAEPEVSSLVGAGLLDVKPVPEEEAVRQALDLVDDQLVDVTMACLAAQQDGRPTVEAVRSALDAFCSCYARNVARALRGEVLIPCTEGGAWYAGISPAALRRVVRGAGTAIAAGVWLVVVIGTGVLLHGSTATLVVGGRVVPLELRAPDVSLCLAVPAVVSVLAHGRGSSTTRRFVRSTVVLVALSLVGAFVASCLDLGVAGRTSGLLAAIFAAAAAAWCPLVLEYATTVAPRAARAVRRLPQDGGAQPHGAALREEAVPASETLGEGAGRVAGSSLAAGSAAGGDDASAMVTYEGPTYEVPHDDADE